MLTGALILTPEVEGLLARAMFPDPERVRQTLETYRTGGPRRVFVWEVEGGPVSAAGVQVGDGGKVGEGGVEVLHLGTAPGEEGQGYARRLLHALLVHLEVPALVAETDDGAVGFYRLAGFEVTPTRPRGGHRRYRVTLTRP